MLILDRKFDCKEKDIGDITFEKFIEGEGLLMVFFKKLNLVMLKK